MSTEPPAYPGGDPKQGYPPPQQQGYPPQQQGYPPQQQGYPPQQQGYPPQQQGYPPNVQYPNATAAAPTTTVIVRQGQTQPRPNDYLAFAILVTIFCCLPFGIVAIVKSVSVGNRYTSGDYSGAQEASRSARCWSIAALVTGIVFSVIWIIIVIVVNVSAAAYVSSINSGFDFDVNGGNSFYGK